MNQGIDYIDNVIRKSRDDISILVKELNHSTDIYKYHSNKKIVAASLIKVPIMLGVLEKVHKKEVSLQQKILVGKCDILYDTEVFENDGKEYSIYELLSWMIITSDNTATNILLKTFGIEYFNHYIKDILNIRSTYLERYMLDKKAKKLNNYTSQEDMFYIFKLLFNKEILTSELCDIAIEILYNQRCQDQVMRYIYEPVRYAHKTGSLDYLNHDAGVMYISGRLFYIGVSIYNCKNKSGNKKLIGKLGKEIYQMIKGIC